ncbi:MAG TPA: VOC family protein [Propionibacteriaceae bacterium]
MSLGTAIPALPVADIAAATGFYTQRLGFTVVHKSPDFAIVARDHCTLHLWLADDRSWPDRRDLSRRPIRSGAESFLAGTASCRIEVPEAAALHALSDEMRTAQTLHRASRDGVTSTDYGHLELHVSDRDGNLLSFFTRL